MRRRVGRIRLLGIASAIATIASCTNSTAPASLPGTYDAHYADGKLLPLRWYPPRGGDNTVFLKSGRLYVTDPDTMWVALTLEHLDVAGNVVDSFPGDSVFFNYVLIGDSVAEADPPGLFVHGIVSGTRVILSVNYPIAPSTGYNSLLHRFDFLKR